MRYDDHDVFFSSNESTDCLQLSTGYRVYSCSAADVCTVAAAAGLGLSGEHSGGISEIHQTLKFLSILFCGSSVYIIYILRAHAYVNMRTHVQ